MSTTSTTQVRVKAVSSRVKDFFFGNLTAKAMALTIALALWFYAYSASRPEETWVVPVEIGMTEGWALSEEEPKVTLTVTYPKALREEFKAARAAGRIRMATTLTPDEQGPDEQPVEIDLGPSSLRAPSGLKVSFRRVIPSRMAVHVVREDTKALAVDVRISDPPAGFAFASPPRAIPDKVTVRGPREVLARSATIETEVVDISNLAPLRGLTFNEKVPARIAQYVTVGDERRAVVCNQEIQVQVVLVPVPKQKTFTQIPIRLLTPRNYPYVVEIRESERATDVDVSGPADVVDKLKPENIVLYVDVSDVQNLKPNTDMPLPYTQPVYVNVVETPRSSELTCRPLLKNCSLTISETGTR